MKGLSELGAKFLYKIYQRSKDTSAFQKKTSINTMIVFAAILHLFFVFYFRIVGIRVFSNINIASVAIYIALIILTIKGHTNAASIITTLEVWAYSMLCVCLMGPDTDIQWYMLLVLIPQFLVFDVSAFQRGFFIVLLSASMLSSPFISYFLPVAYPQSGNIVLRLVNIIVVVFAALIELTVNSIINNIITTINDRDLESFKEKAFIDPLTGLKNRRYADIYFQKLAASLIDDEKISFAMLDIDNFKTINDRFLHETGDRVLAELASVLNQSFRKNDLVCRWGGEEFLIVMRDCRKESAKKIIDDIRKKVMDKSIDKDGVEIKFTFSGGVAQLVGHNVKEAISEADTNLYKAKNSGRNIII